MMADPSGRPPAGGVARRRRERRLRSWFRHEQQTVAMLLATFQHHSAPRGQKTARSGVWGHVQNNTAKVRKRPTPQLELFSLEEEPGGGQPAPLSEVAGWLEKVELHFVEHLAEFAIMLCRRWWTGRRDGRPSTGK